MGFQVLKSGSFHICNPPVVDNDVDLFIYSKEMEDIFARRIANGPGVLGELIKSFPAHKRYLAGFVNQTLTSDNPVFSLYVRQTQYRGRRGIPLYMGRAGILRANNRLRELAALGLVRSSEQYFPITLSDDKHEELDEMFISFRRGRLNVIMVFTELLFERIRMATEIATAHNITDKTRRVKLFEEIRLGRSQLEEICFSGIKAGRNQGDKHEEAVPF